MARIVLVVLILVLSGVFSAMAVQDMGAEQISMDGGSRGEVPFPHLRHQTVLGDCNVCHTLFPQEQGGISRLKKTGELVKKQVMNKHCIKCHKAKKKAGETTGPTTCAKCHVRKKE